MTNWSATATSVHGVAKEQASSTRPGERTRQAIRVLAASLAIIALAVFAGLAITGPYRMPVLRLDYAVAAAVHTWHTPWLDVPMTCCTWVGEMVPMTLASALIFAYLLWKGRRQTALCV